MCSVSTGVRFGAWSLRRRPSMRTRGGEPTLMCRSDPPTSPRARRNGTTLNGSDPVTEECIGPSPGDLEPNGLTRPGRSGGLLQHGEDVALLDDVALRDVQRGDRAVLLGEHRDLHLHRLE